jgi:cytochrome P450
VNDPDFWHRLHTFKGNINKDSHYYLASTATVTIRGNKEHRIRRKAIESFYSPKAASSYEGIIKETLSDLRVQLLRSDRVNLSTAYRAWTFDAMCCIYLGHDPGLRNQADFGRQTHLAYRDFTRMYAVSGLVPGVIARFIAKSLHWHRFIPKGLRLWHDFVTVRYDIR